MLETFLNHLHRRRALTLAFGLLALVAIGGFAATLEVNDSPERWFPESTVEAWDRFQDHYEYGDTLVLGVQYHRPVQDDDFGFLKDIRLRLKKIEGIEDVTDATRVAEELEKVPLTELIALPAEGEEDRFGLYRGAFFDDPSVWKDAEHADDDGRTLLYIILLEDELDESLSPEGQADQLNARRRHVTSRVEELTQEKDKADVTFHMGGGIVVQHELERIARNLILTLVPISLLLALVALGIGFRSWWAVAVAIVGGGWAVAVMLGCVALMGWSLNVVTVAGPTLMAVIIVATTVHIAHYYSVTSHRHDIAPSEHEHELDEPAKAEKKRLTQEDRTHFVHWVAVPCLGAALTTGFGFLMLAFNELQPARELGIELFVGSVLAFFGAYLAWMWFAPFSAGRGTYLSADHLEAAEHRVVKRPLLMTSFLVLILVGLGYSATLVTIDADPFSFFRPHSGPGKALAHFTERKFGFYVLDVVCVPKQEEGDRQSIALANRQRILEFEESLQDRPEMRKIISTASWRSRLEEWEVKRWEALNNFNLKATWDYTRRSIAYREVFKNWLHDHADQDAYRVTFMVFDPGTGFTPLLNDVRKHLPEEHFDCFYTGTAASVAVLSEQLMGGITRGLIAAMIAMALVCLTLFRSVKLTLIAVAPNTFPVLVVFGFMGVFGIPLNCGSAMVTTIALGVGLNDTVHFVMHYRGRRLEGADTETALRGTFGEIGRPIILTSAVNCVGFGIFMLSDFLPMAHFGLLAGIAMLAALVGDLVLLPNLLRLFDQHAWGTETVEAPIPETRQVPVFD